MTVKRLVDPEHRKDYDSEVISLIQNTIRTMTVDLSGMNPEHDTGL